MDEADCPSKAVSYETHIRILDLTPLMPMQSPFGVFLYQCTRDQVLYTPCECAALDVSLIYDGRIVAMLESGYDFPRNTGPILMQLAKIHPPLMAPTRGGSAKRMGGASITWRDSSFSLQEW